jgi:hypothetical protein
MNTYKLTRDGVTKEIEATDERSAWRAFDAPEQSVEVIDGGMGEPKKKRFKVTWGDIVKEVIAVHNDDAWSQFVGDSTDSMEYKYPNLHTRIIEELGPADDSEESEEIADDESAPEEDAVSPVANLNADEAKDTISRMHSRNKLQEIAATDKRVTVSEAAQKRLTEIGG